MKLHVARSAARRNHAETVLLNLRLRRVDFVDHHLVHAEVGDERESLIRRKSRPVSMRCVLAVADDFRTAFVLHQLSSFLDRAVFVDRKNSGRSSTVLSSENGPACRVNRNVSRSAVTNLDGILKAQRRFAFFFFDFVSRNDRFTVQRSDCVNVLAVGMHREKTRPADFSSEFGFRKLARLQTQRRVIDAFALLRSAGPNPDVDRSRIISGRQRRNTQANHYGRHNTKQRNNGTVNQSQHGASPSLVNWQGLRIMTTRPRNVQHSEENLAFKAG